MTDVLLHEELDVSCEHLALTRIEETMELLDCKLNQISVEGRISRADASALVERYAVQFDERYPLNSFTQSPTATNLTIAQEGIVGATGRYLMDLIKQAGALLVKVFRWIIDLVSFRSLRDKRAAKQSKQIKDVQKAQEDLRSAGVTMPPEQMSVTDVLLGQYKAGYNGLTDDLLTSGSMLHLIRDLRDTILQLEETSSLRIEHLQHLLTILPTDENGDAAFEHSAQSALRSGVGADIQAKMKHAGIDYPVAVTSPRVLVNLIVGHLTQLSLNKDIEALPLDVVRTAICDNKNGLSDPILVIPETAIRNVGANIRRLSELKVAANSRSTPVARKVIHRLVNTAIDEALGLQSYLNAVNIYSAARDATVNSVWAYVTLIYQTTYGAGMSDADPAKRQAAERVTDRLRSSM